MTHNIKHKLRNRIFEGAAIATIMIPMASPIIAHATDTATPVKVSTTGTKVKIDDAALQKAIADAKAAGVDLTQEKTDTQTVKSSEVASAKSKITDSYKTQVSTLEAATKKQTTANTDYATKEAQYQKDLAQYNKDEAAYEAEIAKHKDDTPIADKNGIKVYGDYNEAGKGSLDYYKNFDVVVDGSKVKDFASVSDLGWNKDSKVTAIGKTQVLNTDSTNFNAPSKDMYLEKEDTQSAIKSATLSKKEYLTTLLDKYKKGVGWTIVVIKGLSPTWFPRKKKVKYKISVPLMEMAKSLIIWRVPHN